MTDSVVTLSRAPASVTEIVAVARGATVRLEASALAGLRPVQEALEGAVAQGAAIYGLTTGIGDLYSVRLDAGAIRDAQMNMLRSHASGVGEPLDPVAVRAIMVCIIRAMLHGASGVSPELVMVMAEMLNRGVVPWAPVTGSVGYLIATAHIGLAIFGEGQAWFEGALLPGAEALRRAGIAQRTPGLREGHALISGTYEITGIGCLALARASELVALCDLAGAMSLEAMRGNTRGFDPRLQQFRPHPGQIETARRLNLILGGSEILTANRDYRLQDALSLRCMPQVHGAARDALDQALRVLTTEINALTDNPVFLLTPDGLEALPGGNGHGAPTAVALDGLAVGLAALSTISQARCDRLVSAHLSSLPAFLAPDGGGGSGFSISPCVAAALSAENRMLAAPASVHTMSTVAGQEDHLSMGVQAAQKARRATENLADLLSVELLLAAQALDFHAPLRAGRISGAARDLIRTVVPFRRTDTAMSPDLRAIRSLIDEGRLARLLAAAEPAASAAPT